MGRKGQIAYFIIIGIFILIVSLVLYTSKKAEITESSLLKEKKDQIQSYLKLCINDFTYESLLKIAASGGISDDIKQIGNNPIAFWNDGKIDKSPRLEDFEIWVADDSKENINSCYKDLPNIFTDMEFKLSDDLPNIKISYLEDHITVGSDLEFEFIKDGTKGKIEEINTRLDYNFKKDFELARFLLSETLKAQPDYYDILPNCFNYETNSKTNIYTLDVKDGTRDMLVAVVDYEPNFKNLAKTLRINFALRDVNLMGYCTA